MKKHLLPIFAIVILIFASGANASLLTISPKISLGTDYTDNASLDENNGESDIVYTLAPSVDMDYSRKHLELNLYYHYEHEIYGDETDNNSSRHDAGLSAFADLSKHTKLNLQQRFRRIEDPLREQDLVVLPEDDPFLPDDTTVRRSRETYYTLHNYAGLTHQFGEKDFLTFSYSYSLREDYDEEGPADNIERGNDNKMHNPGIGLTYWFTPLYGIDTRFDYTKGEFDNDDDYDDLAGSLTLNRKITRHLNTYLSYSYIWRDYKDDGLDTESDYDIHSSSIGISYQVDKNTSISAGVGYFHQNREDEENENGLFGDIDVTKNWTFPRGNFNLAAMSGIDRNETGYENKGFERYYGIMGRLSYGFTKHFNGTLGLSYRRNESLNTENDQTDDRFIVNAGLSYQPIRRMTIFSNYSQSFLFEDSNEDDDDSGLDDNNRHFDMGVRYEAKRWMFITMKYIHRRLDTDISDEGNDENRASLMVTFVPVRPYRKVY